jgi:hypothetical protein
MEPMDSDTVGNTGGLALNSTLISGRKLATGRKRVS